MIKKVKAVFQKERPEKPTKCVFYDNERKNDFSHKTTQKEANGNEQRHSPKLKTGKSKFYKDIENEEEDGNAKSKIQRGDSPKPSTVLWAESEPVRNSGVLDNMTIYERVLQETKFEIITTELKHLNSLNMLIAVFYQCKPLSATCTSEEWDNLFGNIRIVKDASELLLSDLLAHWQNDIMLNGIYSILRNHATSILRVYVSYCSNQPLANHTLNTLLDKNEDFRKILERIEQSQNETLQTFLTLPIQRVTRLPLLLEAVISRLDQTRTEYTACEQAIFTFKQLANECNEAVHHVHHTVLKHHSEEDLNVKAESDMNSSESDQQTTRRKLTWSTSSSWSV